jgi:branched-subunit amino acid ABC-type transport system permease component
MLLMAIGLTQRRTWRLPALAGTAAAALGAAVMLSYATVTLRYHVDIWPLIGFPAIFGIAALTERAVNRPEARPMVPRALLVALLIGGCLVTFHKTLHSRVTLMEPEGTLAGPWSDAQCLKLIAPKQLGEKRSREVCGLTEKESTT